MKKTLFTLAALFALTMGYSQETHIDTLSTSIGQFILETEGEIPTQSTTSQVINNSDGGATELIIANASSQRLAAQSMQVETTIQAFPNPTADFLTLNVFNASSVIELKITDVSGRILMTDNFSSDNGFYILNLNFSKYALGFFFSRFSLTGESTVSK